MAGKVNTVQQHLPPMEVGNVVEVGEPPSCEGRIKAALPALALIGVVLSSASLPSAAYECSFDITATPTNCTRPRECLLFSQIIDMSVHLVKGDYCTVPHCTKGCSVRNPDVVRVSQSQYAEKELSQYVPGGSLQALQVPGCAPLSQLLGLDYIVDPSSQEQAQAALDKAVRALRAFLFLPLLIFFRLLVLWYSAWCSVGCNTPGPPQHLHRKKISWMRAALTCNCPSILLALAATITLGLAAGILVLYQKYIATYDLSLELLNLNGHGTIDLAGHCTPADMAKLQFSVAAVAVIAFGLSCKLKPCSCSASTL